MRGLEKTQGKDWVSTKNKRTDIPFIRTAVSGDWKDKLPQGSAREIESAWGPLMTKLEYEIGGKRTSDGQDLMDGIEKSAGLQITPVRERV